MIIRESNIKKLSLAKDPSRLNKLRDTGKITKNQYEELMGWWWNFYLKKTTFEEFMDKMPCTWIPEKDGSTRVIILEN